MTTSGPEAEVELVDLPDPHPAAGQLRIRMVGAGVNAADLNIIDGWGRESADGEAPPPLGLGLDVAGSSTWSVPASTASPRAPRSPLSPSRTPRTRSRERPPST